MLILKTGDITLILPEIFLDVPKRSKFKLITQLIVNAP